MAIRKAKANKEYDSAGKQERADEANPKSKAIVVFWHYIIV